eukprot:jgi/Botrbrau1/3473/Bobra.341_2s0005.1
MDTCASDPNAIMRISNERQMLSTYAAMLVFLLLSTLVVYYGLLKKWFSAGRFSRLISVLVDRLTERWGSQGPIQRDLCVVVQHVRFGRSGFGATFLGSWKGMEVTAKVTRDSTAAANVGVFRQRLRMSHPNVAQLYAVRIDPVVQKPVPWDAPYAEKVNAAFTSGALQRKYGGPLYYSLARAIDTCTLVSPHSDENIVSDQILHPAEDTVEVVQIYENFDMGSLRDFISNEAKCARFVAPMNPNRRLCNMSKTLLEIARGLEHIHSLGCVHGGVTTANIFLGSTGPREPRGFTAKLGDFSLGDPSPSSGWHPRKPISIRYLGPEALLSNGPSAASDIYAFGILMYEYYTAKDAYHDLSYGEIRQGKLARNLVPEFPSDAPAALAAVAQRCWDAGLNRLTAQELVAILEKIDIEFRNISLPTDLDLMFASVNDQRVFNEGQHASRALVGCSDNDEVPAKASKPAEELERGALNW